MGRSLGRRALESPRVAASSYAVMDRLMPLYLRCLLSSGKPVIVGPWSSEIGNELLYWIPFLQRLRDQNLLDRTRTFAVSRGDNSVWYKGVAAGCYNFFEDVSIEEYRHHVQSRRRLEKRLFVDALDRRIIELTKRRFGLSSARVLHPMVMNRWFLPVWKGRLPSDLTARHLSFSRFEVPADDVGRTPTVNGKRVAVKFWFNQNFPNVATNVRFVERVVRTLAERYTVLILNARDRFDGHSPVPIALGPSVVDCRDFIAAHDNLRSQTELVARSEYFVGTFGGLGLLPGFLGKTAFVFHSEPFFTAHLDTAFRMWSELTPRGYRIRRVDDFDVGELP